MRFAIVSALVLAACGSNDVCDRAAAETKKEVDEAQPCLTNGATFTFSTNVAACKQQEASCSDNDKKTVAIYFDCLDRIAAPSCSAAASSTANNAAADTYNTALHDCFKSSNVSSISGGCGTALTAAATTHSSI